MPQRSRIDPHIGTHPSMGAIAARFRGPNDPSMPAFAGMADQGVPGVADDLDAITTVLDAGAGMDVTVAFDSGTVLVFEGRGTGAVGSLADLVDDPLTQLVLADSFLF